jgi:hypothetical protein
MRAYICIVLITKEFRPSFYNLLISHIRNNSFISIKGISAVILFTPHYFMFLIVPATFILAYYVKETIAGKIALLELLIIGFNLNISLIQPYNKFF